MLNWIPGVGFILGASFEHPERHPLGSLAEPGVMIRPTCDHHDDGCRFGELTFRLGNRADRFKSLGQHQ